MNHSEKTRIILGPPGTGKTTKLIKMVELFLAENIKPERICFISFTKRASLEARSRAISKFVLTNEQLPYFRTIHSLAFKELKLEPRRVMNFNNYIDICKILGITISSQNVNEDGWSMNHTKGDRLFFIESMARTAKITLKQAFENFINDDLDFRELELLRDTLLKYKEIHNKVDFSDMIVEFTKRKIFIPIDILIVDEAQDLSPIQWDMISIISATAKQIIIAGDDDQAIYTWAGADVNHFINLKGRREVLEQSYRVPAKAYQIAVNILARIKQRTKKVYMPREFQGEFKLINELESMNMDTGTWLLLSRNMFLLYEFVNYCVGKGYLFYSRIGSQIPPDSMHAIRTWENLRLGMEMPADDIKSMYKFMRTKKTITFGFKELLEKVPDTEFLNITTLQEKFGLLTHEPWHKALTKLSPLEIQYFQAAFERGEKVTEEPRIRINTIHGVKGAEADNVVLLTDVSRRTHDEFQRHSDDEWRVWYVAVTRTKSNLFLVLPRTQYFVNLEHDI